MKPVPILYPDHALGVEDLKIPRLHNSKPFPVPAYVSSQDPHPQD